MKKILVLDNYDSFTYNLVHILRELGHGANMVITRNDKLSIDDVDSFSHILLSPGPGLPKDAGIMPELIKTYCKNKNILGVCLGHQAIGEAFGANLYNLPDVYHGVTTGIGICDHDELYNGIPERFNVCRYHSWVIAENDFPDELIITARDDNARIMGVRHKKFNVRGVQYHPESIMTENGEKLMDNWLKLAS